MIERAKENRENFNKMIEGRNLIEIIINPNDFAITVADVDYKAAVSLKSKFTKKFDLNEETKAMENAINYARRCRYIDGDDSDPILGMNLGLVYDNETQEFLGSISVNGRNFTFFGEYFPEYTVIEPSQFIKNKHSEDKVKSISLQR